MLSEYMMQYSVYPKAIPRGSFKPKEAFQRVEIPMEGISTAKRDYIAHKVLPQKLKLPEEYVKSEENMDLTSTYKQDYNSYPACQVPPCIPCVTRRNPSAKMDTRTTYKDDYLQWNQPKMQLIRTNNRFLPSEEKFNHRSIVQADYVYRGPVATKSCKPLMMIQATNAPFANITSYRVNYVSHPLQKRYIHKSEKYKVNKAPFDGLTTHKVSFKGLPGQPAKHAKPVQLKLAPDLPFSAKTEFQENYQPWPQPLIFTKRPDIYLPPLEKMDLHTTTQINYKNPNGKPAKMCKSFAQLQRSTDPFSGSSVMKEDYKPWQCKRVMPIIYVPELTFPAEPMDYLTTFQTDYVPHPLPVMKSYKPVFSGPQHHTPLDAKTTYTTSYTPKGVVKCLASYKDPPGYVLEGVDSAGHSLYLPASKREYPQAMC